MGNVARRKPCPRILLVEDDPNDTFVFLSAAKGMDCIGEIMVVESGEEGLHLLEELREAPLPERPALIVVDINLPGMNGLEVLPQIRAMVEYSLTPIIVLSTSDYDPDIRTALTRGASAYVTKLFSYPHHMELVQAMLTFWCRYAARTEA
ncbi:MAG TPA: response regulator [Salinarimonas sp.]|nr:response regulator [Salinarimonas sp.]